MGTRSITYFLDDDKKKFASMYCQFDGYPDGVGDDIKNILGPRVVVNGFNNGATQVNGIHCAAALLISSLKDGAGNVYLYGPKAPPEEYVYKLWVEHGELWISVKGAYGKKYSSKLSEYSSKDANELINGD